MTAPALTPHAIHPAGNVDHLYCCNPNLALCGTDLTHVPEGREHDTMCPRCVAADDSGQPCPNPDCPDPAVTP